MPYVTPSSVPDRLVEAHAVALFRFALSRLRNRSDAEDVVQEVLLAAIRGASPFRGDATERTWLIGILRNKIVDRLRARVREAPVDEDEPAWWDAFGRWKRTPAAWGDDPQARSEFEEMRGVINGCLASLPGRQSQAIVLRLVDGMVGAEVATTLGVTESHLAVLLHRARLRLRECLERRWFGVTA